MILVSKLVFGSVAMATLAGSVVFTDAVEASRSVVASMGWVAAAEAPPSEPQPSVIEQPGVPQSHAVTYGTGQFPATLQHCPGRCDMALVFSQIR